MPIHPSNPRPKSNPFGSSIITRSYSAGSGFRFGFNGFEKDTEVKGTDNQFSFSDFGYDSRNGMRWSIDKHTFKYSSNSPYSAFNSNPIIYSDPDGKDAIVTIRNNIISVSTKIVLWGADATKDAVTKFKSEINATWNANSLNYKDAKNGIVYKVKFNIQIELAEGNERESSIPFGAYNPLNTNNYVEVNNTKLDAENAVDGTVANTLGGDEGLFGTSKQDYIKSVPHEVGHMLGLDDRYNANGDAIGWENNVMGAGDGKDGKTGSGNVDQRNVDAVVGPSVKAFNKVKEVAISQNKLREKMISLCGRAYIFVYAHHK
jgi:hypothetical protein